MSALLTPWNGMLNSHVPIIATLVPWLSWFGMVWYGVCRQDWLRSTLIHCNAQRYRLRTAGRNFLTYLLRSAFHYYGSIAVVRQPLMAVFQGMIRCEVV